MIRLDLFMDFQEKWVERQGKVATAIINISLCIKIFPLSSNSKFWRKQDKRPKELSSLGLS
jgi:hypothetical protein